MKSGIYYCKDYNIDNILPVLEKYLSKYLHTETIFSNKKILLKPNLLSPSHPEKNITTNPAIIEALIIILKKYNTNIAICDSPAAPYTNYNQLIKKTGIENLIKNYSIKLDTLQNYTIQKYVFNNREFYLSNIINEYDYIINLPKFKTHTLTTITGAVKNLFGFVPGMLKINFHNNFDEMVIFAKALNYLASLISNKIPLVIMDAIEAMEGEGPSNGKAIKLNSIIISDSIYGADLTAAKLTGLNIDDILFLKSGYNENYYKKNDLLIIDNEINEIKPIKLPIQNILVKILPYKLFKLASKICKIKPVVKKNICKKCYLCIKICSKNCIIKDKNEIPFIKHKNCIQCFCCSEVCPHNAIELKDNLILKLYKILKK